MFFRSLFYERTVLAHLERVQQLPPHVQAEIAMRVSNFIEQARSVSDEFLVRFAHAAREELTQAVDKRGEVRHGSAMGCTGNLRGMV